MSESTAGLVTVCIVTYEGEQWIEACLRSVLSQSYRHVEVIVYDNASADETAARAQHILEAARASIFLQGDRNVGYAAGHNAAIARARGEFICLLNQDVVLDDGYLEAAVEAFGSSADVGAVQGLILRLGPDLERTSVIDSAGLVQFRNRRIVSKAQGVSFAEFGEPAGGVFGPDGPAPVYRMSALASARVRVTPTIDEILDESFFLYHEDTDLAWRLRALGWTTWYQPSAIAWHARGSPGPTDLGWLGLARHGAAMSDRARLLSWRKSATQHPEERSARRVPARSRADRPSGGWVRRAPVRRRSPSPLDRRIPAPPSPFSLAQAPQHAPCPSCGGPAGSGENRRRVGGTGACQVSSARTTRGAGASRRIPASGPAKAGATGHARSVLQHLNVRVLLQ